MSEVKRYSIYTDLNPDDETLKLLDMKYRALVTGALYDQNEPELNHIQWAIAQVIRQLQNVWGETGESHSVLVEIIRSDSGFGIRIINLESEIANSIDANNL